MDASRRRLLQGLGAAALAIGGLTAGACYHPPEPVHDVTVERTAEQAMTGDGWFAGRAVVYRLTVRREDLDRLTDGEGRVRFRIFSCPHGDPEREVPATLIAVPGDTVRAHIRLLVPRRAVEGRARQCGHFVRPSLFIIGEDDPVSDSFRFEAGASGEPVGSTAD